MPDRTQEIKNLRQVFTASVNYTDKRIEDLEWQLGTYDLGVETDSDVSRIKSLPSNTIKSMVDYIGGKSVKYNQFLINNESTVTRNGITFTNNGNGTWTVNGTSTARANTAVNLATFKIPVKLNDKIFIIGCPSGGSGSTYYLAPVFYNDGSYVTFDINNTDVGNGKIVTVTNSNVNEARIEIIGAQDADQTVNNLLFKPELINLTEKFGEGNEPSTVETAIPLLKANGYKLDGTDTYSTGSLKHAVVSGVKYEGNLFNINATHTTVAGTTTIEGTAITINATYYCDFEITLPKGTYTISYNLTSSNPNVGIRLQYTDNTYSSILTNGQTVVTDKETKKMLLYSSFGTTATAVYSNVILVKGSTAPSTYIPYVAPITKAIPSEVLADVRYGLGYDNTNYNHLDSDGHLRGEWNIYTFTGNENVIESTVANNDKRYLIAMPSDCKSVPVTDVANAILSANYTLRIGNDIYNNNNVGYSINAQNFNFYDTAIQTEQAFRTFITGKSILYKTTTAFDQDYSQYFTDGWNKVDLDKQYATCEMVVAEPIDMPNSITNLIEEVKA